MKRKNFCICLACAFLITNLFGFTSVATTPTPNNNNNTVSSSKDSVFRDRISAYIKRQVGDTLSQQKIELYFYKGIYFYYNKNSNYISSFKDIIHTTVNKMDEKSSNKDIWDLYGEYPIYIDKEYGSEITKGASASYTNNIVYCYYSKFRLTKDNFSPVIPHELGHFVRRKLDKKDGASAKTGWLMDVMDGYYKEFLDKKPKDEHDSSSEYFSNTSEAYYYWSNESDPEDTAELKQKYPNLYDFLEKLYNPNNNDNNNNNNASFTLSKNVYDYKKKIKVKFKNLPGNSLDWVGLFKRGDDDTEYLRYIYSEGDSNGTMKFKGLPSGEYEARLFFNDSYDREASVSFTVKGKRDKKKK